MKDEKDWGPADYVAQGQVYGALAFFAFIAVAVVAGLLSWWLT